MTKGIIPNRVYRGVTISYTPAVGARLPWSAYVRGYFVTADTLAGIKLAIREELEDTRS